MSDPILDADEKPLDPAVARVAARVRRLILISGLTLGVGILAVFGAVLYKVMVLKVPDVPPAVATSGPVPTLSLSALGLPPDARLVSTALDGGRVAFTYAVNASTVTVVVDIATQTVVGRLAIGPQ